MSQRQDHDRDIAGIYYVTDYIAEIRSDCTIISVQAGKCFLHLHTHTHTCVEPERKVLDPVHTSPLLSLPPPSLLLSHYHLSSLSLPLPLSYYPITTSRPSLPPSLSPIIPLPPLVPLSPPPSLLLSHYHLSSLSPSLPLSPIIPLPPLVPLSLPPSLSPIIPLPPLVPLSLPPSLLLSHYHLSSLSPSLSPCLFFSTFRKYGSLKKLTEQDAWKSDYQMI